MALEIESTDCIPSGESQTAFVVRFVDGQEALLILRMQDERRPWHPADRGWQYDSNESGMLDGRPIFREVWVKG